MAKITDIKPQAHNKSRVSVFADDEFLCGLEKLTVLTHRLKTGDEVNPEVLSAAVFDSECGAAFEKAAKYLGARPRSESEMRTYLIGKGYAQDVIDATIEKLMSYGYIDDAEYCRIYIDTYKHKSGARKLEAELRAKGIARETIEEALESIDDQSEAAMRLAEKYLSSHAPDKRKLTAYLMSKGFDYDTIKSALSDSDFGVTLE